MDRPAVDDLIANTGCMISQSNARQHKRSVGMRRMNVFAVAASLLLTASAGAQQAAVPKPPKAVHPGPQQPSACRGCTETVSDKKTNVGGYDAKPDSTRKSTPRATKPSATKAKAD